MALITDVRVGAGRDPRAWDFVRLKLRLLRNGFRGQVGRIIVFVLALCFGLLFAVLALVGLGVTGLASRDVGFVVAAFAGTAVILAWTLVPLLFFGVDETLDPARFALLPLPRMRLARGMLAAAFVGAPALVTFIATAGVAVAATVRFGWGTGLVALVGVAGGLAIAVVASRAVTSAFAALLRSRRARDLAAVLLALLASSVGPLQWLIPTAASHGNITQALRVADILAWTPFGAPYVFAFDVAEGHYLAAAARVLITVASISLLLFWWSRTIESAMLGATTGAGGGSSVRASARDKATGRSAGAGLIARPLRRIVGTGVFGVILARESRYWWRDPRRRAALLSILIASAVVPIALNFAAGAPAGVGVSFYLPGFTFAVTMAGTMGGMLLANQFAYDGSAFAAHLLAGVPGRIELRARAAAIAMVAIPVQLAVVVVVTILSGTFDQLPTGLGLLAASFGASVAGSGVLSVLVPYALPESSSPFAMNSGSGSAKGIFALLGLIVTLVSSTPVVVAAFLLADLPFGPYAVLVIGAAYGLAIAWLGTIIAGRVLDRRGPEILIAITPRR